MAQTYIQQKQYLKAIDRLREALRLEQAQGNRWNEIRILNNIGAVYLQQGWYDNARRIFEDVLTLNREYGLNDAQTETTAHLNIGTAYRNTAVILAHQRSTAEARTAFRHALAAYRQAFTLQHHREDADEFTYALNILDRLEMRLARNEDILTLLQETSSLNQPFESTQSVPEPVSQPDDFPEPARGQDYERQAVELRAHAQTARQKRQYEDAEDLFRQALDLYQKHGDLRGEGETLQQLARVYSDQAQRPPRGKSSVTLWNQFAETHQLALAILAEVDEDFNRKLAEQQYGKGGLQWDAVEAFGLDMALLIDTLPPGFSSASGSEYPQSALSQTQLHQADALAKRANAYFRVGKTRRALTMLHEEHLIREEIGDQFGQFDVVERILNVQAEQQPLILQEQTIHEFETLAMEFGYTEKAVAVWQRLQQDAHKEQDACQEAAISNRIGTIRLSLGQLADAERAFLEADAIQRTSSCQADRATTFNNRGLLRYQLGQYHKAAEFFLTSLEILATHEHPPAPPQGGNLPTPTPSQEGKTPPGPPQGEKTTSGPQREAVVRHHFALLLHQQARQEEASGEYDMAQQRNTEALNHLRTALQLLHSSEDAATSQPFRAILNQQGIIHYASGRLHDKQQKPVQAETFYENALEIYQTALQQPGSDAGTGAILHNIGMVHVCLQQFEHAMNMFRQALKLEERTGNIVDQTRTLAEIGALYEQHDDLERALSYYMDAISRYETIRHKAEIETFKMNVAEQSVDVYQQAILILLKLRREEDAFNLSEQARARAFLDRLETPREDSRRGLALRLLAAEREVEQEIIRLKQAVDLLERQYLKEEDWKKQEEINQQIKSLQADILTQKGVHDELLFRIEINQKKADSLQRVNPLTLEQVQTFLPEVSTLISYVVTPETTLAFVVTAKALYTVELAVREEELRQAVAVFHSPRSVDADDIRRTLQHLHDWLIAPLRPSLKTPLAGIIPHRVLHGLPFAALFRENTSLGDEYRLFTLPSCSSLRFIQAKQQFVTTRDMAMPRSQDTCFAAAIGYSPEGELHLDGPDEEVASLQQLFETCGVTGDKATETWVKHNAAQAGIVHISAHGVLKHNELAAFSHLLLKTDEQNDGLLEIHEIYELDLPYAELVTLSACNSGTGSRSRGDDMVSLNRAFMYAGASSVVASLWSVDDLTTRDFMAAFYTALQQGHSKAAALQYARKTIRAEKPHPYYWAAFVLTGDPGRVSNMVTAAQQTTADYRK